MKDAIETGKCIVCDEPVHDGVDEEDNGPSFDYVTVERDFNQRIHIDDCLRRWALAGT